jgi:hypothetical protein
MIVESKLAEISELLMEMQARGGKTMIPADQLLALRSNTLLAQHMEEAALSGEPVAAAVARSRISRAVPEEPTSTNFRPSCSSGTATA